MGKGSLFFAKARGKIGEIVLSNVNGQEVQRAYNGSPANPRTANQMYQRGNFADVVKFFTRGQQNFFKFAFENKKKTESDYNAFVRTNMKYGAYLTKYVIDDPTMPKVGEFIVTQGSIPTAEYIFSMEEANIGVAFPVYSASSPVTTVGQLSALMKQWNSAVVEGDIITLVTISSGYKYSFDGDIEQSFMVKDTTSLSEPRWNIRQFIINENDDTLLSEIGLLVVVRANALNLLDSYELPDGNQRRICAAALCVSRNAPGGLKVMTSQLVLSYGSKAIMHYCGVQSDTLTQRYRNVYLTSWGASQEVILQGALARKVEAPEVVEVTGISEAWCESFDAAVVSATTTDLPQALGALSIAEGTRYVKISGSGLYGLSAADFHFSSYLASLMAVVPISDTELIVGIEGDGVSEDSIIVDILKDPVFAFTITE